MLTNDLDLGLFLVQVYDLLNSIIIFVFKLCFVNLNDQTRQALEDSQEGRARRAWSHLSGREFSRRAQIGGCIKKSNLLLPAKQ